MPISRREFTRRATAFGTLLAPAVLGAARPIPRLVVILVAEALRSSDLERNWPRFGKDGFRRLAEDGCYFPDCRMSASTFTSAGLATVATGAWPQSHGIVADVWYDPALRRAMHARPEDVIATTLADQIALNPQNRIFAVGLNETHVAFLAGRNPQTLFAMDTRGDFTVRGSAPVPWFGAFQRAVPAANLHDAPWLALGAKTGSAPLRVLKYDADRPADFVFLYKASPFAQSNEFELARELIQREKLGQGSGVDYLVLAPGSAALLGYDVGAESPLMDQLMLHLDREIEQTLDVLGKVVGVGNYAMVTTAAHGGPAGPPRGAIAGDQVAHLIEKSLAGVFKSVAVDRYVYPFLYLRAPAAFDRRSLRDAAGKAALQVPGVAGYFTADGDCSHGGEWFRRFRNSFHAVRSGDLMLAYAPGYVEDFGSGRGVSYGSLYNYDSRVPLIFYGPQFRPRTFEEPVEAIDIAPTLARLTGIGYPSSASGRVLGEAFTPLGELR